VLDLRVNGIDAQARVEVSRTGELLPINGPDNNEAFHNPLLRNNYTWISSNPNILEVNSFGVLIGRGVGRTTILSIYNNNQRWRADTFTVWNGQRRKSGNRGFKWKRCAYSYWD